jgi:hypothetical protein
MTAIARHVIYILRLRFQRDDGNIRKLRAILKALLRRYLVRCVSVEEERRPSKPLQISRETPQ